MTPSSPSTMPTSSNLEQEVEEKKRKEEEEEEEEVEFQDDEEEEDEKEDKMEEEEQTDFEPQKRKNQNEFWNYIETYFTPITSTEKLNFLQPKAVDLDFTIPPLGKHYSQVKITNSFILGLDGRRF
jgi:hypothetical protein